MTRRRDSAGRFTAAAAEAEDKQRLARLWPELDDEVVLADVLVDERRFGASTRADIHAKAARCFLPVRRDL
jgi:hypothetical protein